MKERMNIQKAEPAIYRAMDVSEEALTGFRISKALAELVRIRVSQINGCGYCVNMHSRDARKAGESEQRTYAVSAWWETPYYTEKEGAALRFAEEVTRISTAGVQDSTYENLRSYFDETEIAQLLFIIVTINSWNRLAIAVHMVAEP